MIKVTDDIFELEDGCNNLTKKFLGLEMHMPGWECLIMAPPTIDESGVVVNTDHTKDSMQRSANLGVILQLGDKAYIEVDKDNIPLVDQPKKPYKVGDLIVFEEMRPEPRYINGVMVYFIPDIRNMASFIDPLYFDHYLMFYQKFPDYIKAAKEWVNMSLEDRIRTAALRRYQF